MTIAQPVSAKRPSLARTQPSSVHIPKVNPLVKIPSSFSSSAALNKAKSSNFRVDSKQQQPLRAAVPPEALIDIEEIDDIMEHMYNIESSTMPNVELIDLQPELRWHMRPYLIDFLVEVHHQSRLRPETLYLAVNIVDRYVSRRIVYKKHYQLVGCAALWIAAKYEDAKDRVPTVEDLTRMCCGAYEESAFVQMERHVLDTLSWSLGHPSADTWLRLYCQGPWSGRFRPGHYNRATAAPEDVAVQNLARFLLELTLFSRSFVAQRPSMLAKAALLLARFISSRPRRVSDEDQQSLRIAAALDSSLARHLGQGPPVSSIVANKYSHAGFSRASLVATRFYQQGGRFSWYPIEDRSAALSNGSSSVSSIASAASASSTSYNTSSASSAETSFTSFDMCSSPSSASSVSSPSCHHSHTKDDGDDIEMDSDDGEEGMPDTPDSDHEYQTSLPHPANENNAINRPVAPAVASNSVQNICSAHSEAQRQAYKAAREAAIPRCYSSGTNIKVKLGDNQRSTSADRVARYHPSTTKYHPLSKSTTTEWEVNVVSHAMISTYNNSRV